MPSPPLFSFFFKLGFMYPRLASTSLVKGDVELLIILSFSCSTSRVLGVGHHAHFIGPWALFMLAKNWPTELSPNAVVVLKLGFCVTCVFVYFLIMPIMPFLLLPVYFVSKYVLLPSGFTQAVQKLNSRQNEIMVQSLEIIIFV